MFSNWSVSAVIFPEGLITAEVKGSGFLSELMAETSRMFLGRRWGEQTHVHVRVHTHTHAAIHVSPILDLLTRIN